MTLIRQAPCKINLLLNVLGRRADGFHELETVLQPIPLCDRLEFARAPAGIQLKCSDPALPAGPSNLVHRAASAFLEAAGIREGVVIHLEKRLPLAAGLGGGSSNAAATLTALNELFDRPLEPARLHALAARLGSDVPFFLGAEPALATGRGEQLERLAPFEALRGSVVLLVYPGFGVSTPWAYQELQRFPQAVNGRPGRARALVAALRSGDPEAAGRCFFNSLEVPVLAKYPVLALYQEFLRERGAVATLMSGSGSTTFALFRDRPVAEQAAEAFKARFGERGWMQLAPLC
jgi:4-diphosphocytidyl-2-C-methyl-D-erythritol kinase